MAQVKSVLRAYKQACLIISRRQFLRLHIAGNQLNRLISLLTPNDRVAECVYGNDKFISDVRGNVLKEPEQHA